MLRVPFLVGGGRCCLSHHILRPLSRHSVVRAIATPAWRGLLHRLRDGLLYRERSPFRLCRLECLCTQGLARRGSSARTAYGRSSGRSPARLARRRPLRAWSTTACPFSSRSRPVIRPNPSDDPVMKTVAILPSVISSLGREPMRAAHPGAHAPASCSCLMSSSELAWTFPGKAVVRSAYRV
jgi:hypothetical protein